jgi:hypothetical protein
MALLDGLLHDLHIDHTANAVAGLVIADAETGSQQNDIDGAALRQHLPSHNLSHHHVGDGMFSPWVCVTSQCVVLAVPRESRAVVAIIAREMARAERRDRPPKRTLELQA